MSETTRIRAANRRTALILGAVALAFFIAVVLRHSIFR
ncbi:MAG: cytochrome oxidase small assembly protein [Burkholderiaceae bacterium]